jgi:hypothetical protein
MFDALRNWFATSTLICSAPTNRQSRLPTQQDQRSSTMTSQSFTYAPDRGGTCGVTVSSEQVTAVRSNLLRYKSMPPEVSPHSRIGTASRLARLHSMQPASSPVALCKPRMPAAHVRKQLSQQEQYSVHATCVTVPGSTSQYSQHSRHMHVCLQPAPAPTQDPGCSPSLSPLYLAGTCQRMSALSC